MVAAIEHQPELLVNSVEIVALTPEQLSVFKIAAFAQRFTENKDFYSTALSSIPQIESQPEILGSIAGYFVRWLSSIDLSKQLNFDTNPIRTKTEQLAELFPALLPSFLLFFLQSLRGVEIVSEEKSPLRKLEHEIYAEMKERLVEPKFREQMPPVLGEMLKVATTKNQATITISFKHLEHSIDIDFGLQMMEGDSLKEWLVEYMQEYLLDKLNKTPSMSMSTQSEYEVKNIDKFIIYHSVKKRILQLVDERPDFFVAPSEATDLWNRKYQFICQVLEGYEVKPENRKDVLKAFCEGKVDDNYCVLSTWSIIEVIFYSLGYGHFHDRDIAIDRLGFVLRSRNDMNWSARVNLVRNTLGILSK